MRAAGRTGLTLFIAVLLACAGLFLTPQDVPARDGSQAARQGGIVGERIIPLKMTGNRVDLSFLVSVFSLRSSLDIMGERLDLVGSAGSCRLHIGSPLVLSRGLFAVLTAPIELLGGRVELPGDFLTKGLPALLGRSVTVSEPGDSIILGPEGSGSFKGVEPEDLPRYASFIEREQYLQEKEEVKRPRGLSVVVLDPGHGGRSLGAKGSTGTLEKKLVLSVAEKLKRMLEEDLGVKVVLTRAADYFVGLKERTAIANNNRADLFLSIHANAAFRKEVAGYETYYLSFSATDLDASQLAQVENRALGVEGGREEAPLLEAILWDMAQMEFLRESEQFAVRVQESLVETMKGRNRGVRQAPLAVLMGAGMPAALVEVGFVSNPSQEIKLNKDSHQERIARALFDAIAQYHRSLIRGEIERGTL